MKHNLLLQHSLTLLLNLFIYISADSITLSCRMQLDYYYMTLSFNNTETQFTKHTKTIIQSKKTGEKWQNGSNCKKTIIKDNYKIECRMQSISFRGAIPFETFYKLRILARKGNNKIVIKPKTDIYYYSLEYFKCFSDHSPINFETVGFAETKLNISWHMYEYDKPNWIIDSSTISVKHQDSSDQMKFPLVRSKRCNEEGCQYQLTGLTPCTKYKICLNVLYSFPELDNTKCILERTLCAPPPPEDTTKCVTVVIITVTVLVFVLLIILLAWLYIHRKRPGGNTSSESEDPLIDIEPRNDYNYPADTQFEDNAYDHT